MLFRSDSVRHKFPLQATYFRRVLPHVCGFPTLRVLRSIRLPISIRWAFPFHGDAPPTCTAFRIRHLGSGIALSPGFPLRASITVYPTTAFPQPGANGASQVLQRISSYMPQPENSDGHPHPHLNGCFILASGNVKSLAIRSKLISKLYQLSGYAVTPAACRMLCVRFNCFVRQHKNRRLRRSCNTRYGWVASPYPTGTFTRLDAPSLSWRDNVAVHPAEGRRAAPLPRIGCNGLLAFTLYPSPELNAS